MKIKELLESYGSAKYGKDPETKKKVVADFEKEMKKLKKDLKAAEDKEDWDTYDKVEEKIKLAKAKFESVIAYL